MLPLIAVSAKPKRFRSPAPVHPAPLGGRDAHLVLKRALEGGLGLVAGKLGDGSGRHFRCVERVDSDRYANVSQQLAGRTAETPSSSSSPYRPNTRNGSRYCPPPCTTLPPARRCRRLLISISTISSPSTRRADTDATERCPN